MSADISSADVYTDFQGLARLRYASKDESPEALRAVAKQFEAIFMQMMLKNMREASFGDGIFDNDQTKFYQEMFDKQISISMSEKQGIGIADMIVKQLSRHNAAETANDPKPDEKSSDPLQSISKKINNEPNLTSPDDFVNSLKPIADKVSKDTGITPDVLLAQAALETGWGKEVIQHSDGRSSHNLFGIKADNRWQGERVLSSSIEYKDGIATKHDAVFRSYDSFEQSFRDYADFLKTNKRYEHALTQAGDPAGFVSALQEAGYATDPDYAQKINGILQQPAFSSATDPVKETEG